MTTSTDEIRGASPGKMWPPVPGARKDREEIIAVASGAWDGQRDFLYKIVIIRRISV